MKKFYSLFLFLILFATTTYAQKPANIWYFGQSAGIDFNNDTAIAITGHQMQVSGGTAVISDTSGRVLFYTDGMSVWDSTHVLMTNGTGLLGGFATQPAIIIPWPGNDSLYFIFTVDAAGGSNGFNYSVVNIFTSTVVIKNMPLYTKTTEKLNAVENANGTDYWVMTHDFGTNVFRAHLVNTLGIETTPVLSNVGAIHDSSSIGNAIGQLKFAPCGNKVAVAIRSLDIVQVFDFDNATGIVSNPITIPFDDHVYGLEFSDDGSKLYVSSYDVNGTLLQFNLNAGDATAIIASKVILSMTPDIYALQLATNGKIYVSKSFSQFLGVIDNADSTVAIYNENGFDLDPTASGLITSGLGLPNFIQSYFL